MGVEETPLMSSLGSAYHRHAPINWKPCKADALFTFLLLHLENKGKNAKSGSDVQTLCYLPVTYGDIPGDFLLSIQLFPLFGIYFCSSLKKWTCSSFFFVYLAIFYHLVSFFLLILFSLPPPNVLQSLFIKKKSF